MNSSRAVFPTITAILAVAVAALAVLAGFGTRWDWWNFRTGLSILRWALYATVLVIVLAALALYVTRAGSKRNRWLAGFALLVGFVMIGNALVWRNRARSAPPIHDITTDTENPPEFVAITPLRADAANPAAYGGAEIAAQQRKGYPDLQTVELEQPAPEAFQRALGIARDLGWQIVAEEPDEGRIEATDQTFWFGFKDDIVIRITPLGARSRVDIRSVSRVGRSDVGTNARRIRDFITRLRTATN